MKSIAVIGGLLAFIFAVAATPGHGRAGGFESTDRIIGGNTATIQQFPYMAAVRQSFWIWDTHLCGGSIISSYWVLTAAHCTARHGVRDLFVRVGSSESGAGQRHDLAGIVTHPNYTATNTSVNYDLSLLKVQKEMSFSSNVQPVKLAPQHLDVPAGVLATVAGWGSTSRNGTAVDSLRSLTLPVLSVAECDEVYSSDLDPSTMICAGSGDGAHDVCYGDSGGPLVVGGLQVGVVSWGEGCALSNYPAVFVALASLGEWVRDLTGA